MLPLKNLFSPELKAPKVGRKESVSSYLGVKPFCRIDGSKV